MSTFGIVLMLLGAALAAAEAHVPSHGALGGSAAVAIAAGIALVVAGAVAARGRADARVRAETVPILEGAAAGGSG